MAIDINTGRNKGGRDQDKTILNTNLEAADEISRQLRLRNIGGLVVIDFIDMKDRRDRNAVYQKLKEGIKRDKAKTNVLQISELGLLEMTRQRVQESISRTLYDECSHCRGKGRIKSAESMSVEVQRAIIRIMRLHPDIHEVRVHVHPAVIERFKSEDEEHFLELERRFDGRLSFRSEPKFHMEEFKILNSLTEEELMAKS